MSRNIIFAEQEGTSVVRERRDKQVPATMDTHATIEELLETVFSVRSALRLNKEK
jgi:hypothetical protein